MLEKLAFSTLAEQRAARRWRTFTRLAWLAFFIFIVWWGLSREMSTASSKSSPHTAVVDIKGEIASGAEASAEYVVAALRSAGADGYALYSYRWLFANTQPTAAAEVAALTAANG